MNRNGFKPSERLQPTNRSSKLLRLAPKKRENIDTLLFNLLGGNLAKILAANGRRMSQSRRSWDDNPSRTAAGTTTGSGNNFANALNAIIMGSVLNLLKLTHVVLQKLRNPNSTIRAADAAKVRK